MAALFPFAALRPTAEAAPAVASVPYDVVSTEEARALVAGNPQSFLHVSRAEIDFPPATDPYAAQVYDRAVENFARLQSDGTLQQDPTPGLYVYRLEMGGHVQTGVAGCFAIDEYDNGRIKRHEKTRPDKEDDRTRHLLALEAQTGPVFLVHRATPQIDSVVERVTATVPLYDFVADDGVRHVVWRANAFEQQALVVAFAGVQALYIADGHHRAASAARARRERRSRGAGEHDRVLAVAFPDTQTQILPYHRVVRDLNALSPAQFFEVVAAGGGQVAHGTGSSPGRGEVGVYVQGQWYSLVLPKAQRSSAADTLDVSRLQDSVLEPVLGIRDVRTDKRIDFVGGIRGIPELTRRVDEGGFAVAFAMHPVDIGDLLRISDEGGIMPPKSTWFEPKLRDGLLSHLI